ncbi:MAG: haloacid dehalogenase-like hydrolase [Prevotella sp.]|nr:haloacid dehalogenase-like hydrolase [Prevotella sp.]
MKQVVAFDFDGTLTSRDTFIALLRYAAGSWRLAMGLLRYAPQLLLMRLHLFPNGRTKELVFSHFFRGMKIEDFDALCRQFAKEHHHLLRPAAITTLQRAIGEGADVLVISASIDNWVQPFLPQVTVAGTRVEVKDGRLTGRFTTKNCYGAEKVARLLEHYPQRSEYRLTAYGDSRGDKELLAYADEAHFKPFRNDSI